MEQYTIPGVPPLFGAESLLRDHHGALWIGTMQHGLLRVQDGTIHLVSQENGLSGDLVSALFEDREGTIWVGTTNGLDRFREAAVSTISANQGLSTPVACVLAARDGSLWIGSYGGLNRWRQGRDDHLSCDGPARRAPSAAQEPRDWSRDLARSLEVTDPGLPDNAIDSLFEDPRGRIWVGTRPRRSLVREWQIHIA